MFRYIGVAYMYIRPEHGDGHHIYLTAGVFESHDVPHYPYPRDATPDYPPKNRIYIAKKKGPVYSAPMIVYNPPPVHLHSVARLRSDAHLHSDAHFHNDTHLHSGAHP